MREDIDKIQQNQLLAKVWLEDQIRQLINNAAFPRQDSLSDPTVFQSSTDILANLQILQSTLYSLRRMADTLQSSIGVLKINVTDLTNVTRLVSWNFERKKFLICSYLSLQLLCILLNKYQKQTLKNREIRKTMCYI